MPFGYVSAGASVVGAIGSLSSGGSGNSPSQAGWQANAMALTDLVGENDINNNPYTFQPQWADQTQQAQGLQSQAGAMANQFNTGQQGLTAQQNALSGQVTNASNAYLNSGNQGQYQSAMNALQPAYYGQGNMDMGVAGSLYGQMGQAQAYGNQIMQTAFDPQQALYGQQYQLQSQQTAANQASRGLTMSPVGAELSNQADQNFNINWQNQQLARQTAGLAAYDTNNQSIDALGQGAVLAGQQGLTNYTTGAGIPYNTAQTIYNNNQAAYGNQQTALTAEQAAYLQQQQTAQQGFSNQAQALTGSQQALMNQQNNLSASNAFFQQNASNLMNYYNGSAPASMGGNSGSVANGYAGLGNYLGSNSFQQALGNGQTGLSGAYNNAYINSTANNGDNFDYLANQGSNAYTGTSSPYSIPTSGAFDSATTGAGDLAGFAALGG